jgi:hypothetical protein
MSVQMSYTMGRKCPGALVCCSHTLSMSPTTLSCGTYVLNSKCNLWTMVKSARSHQSHPKCTVNAWYAQENNARSSLYIFMQQNTAFLRHAAQSLFCFQQNAICSIILSFPVKIIFTFYIKQALKFKYPPHRIKVQKRLNLMLYHRTFTNQLPNVDLNWCCAECSAMLYIFPNIKSCTDVILTSQCGIYCSICDMFFLGREEYSIQQS